MINNVQHEFLHERSCVTQLLSTLHHIGQLLDRNTQTDVFFIVFAKAFDSVDHGILLKKLKSYGISGNIYNLFNNCLHGRTQRVVLEVAASKWSPVTSGVPQGSILGPVLFPLFINNLPDVMPPETSTTLYADDTKLYRTVTSLEDCSYLQEALFCADKWSKVSNINFNSSKCKVLTLSRRKSPFVSNYHPGPTQLIRVDCKVDLGITVSYNLSWNKHIALIVAKANKMLGLLRRTCLMLVNQDARRTLYQSLVNSR